MTGVDFGIIAEIVVIAILMAVLLTLMFKPVKKSAGIVKEVKVNKKAAVITYILALLCLWAGLVAPMYYVGGETFTDRMLLMYIPSALNSALGVQLVSGDWLKAFTEAYSGTIFGSSLNIYAYTLVLYAIVSVLGIIFLLPVVLIKKDKVKCVVFAYVIEVVAAVTLAIYALFAMQRVVSGGEWSNYGIIISLAGVLLILAVQSIINKGSLGTVKVVLFALSAIATLALFNLGALLSFLATPLTNLASTVNTEATFGGLAVGFGYVANYALDFSNLGTAIAEAATTTDKIILVMLMGAASMCVINLIFDIIGLAAFSKYDRDGYLAVNAFSKIVGFLRYMLELIFAVAAIVMLIVIKNTVGLYLYALAVVALAQMVIEIVRLCRCAKLAKINENTLRTYEYGDDMDFDEGYSGQTDEYTTVVYVDNHGDEISAETAEVLEEESEEQVSTVSQAYYSDEEQNPVTPATEDMGFNEVVEGDSISLADGQTDLDEQSSTVEEQTHTIYYNVKTVYNGPTDSFIETLSDEEKVEFHKVFIEKSKGTTLDLPDYVLEGENQEFFSKVFVRLSSFRDMLTSGLLHKIYLQVEDIGK